MVKVIFTQGLPGSGKSTWAKEYCLKHQNTVRVSRDDLRNMRGKYWLPKQEGLISAWEQECIAAALDQGYNVIVDATNFNERYVKEIKELCTMVDESVQFEFKVFDTPVEECIKRDAARANSVGAKVIKEFYYKYIAKIDKVQSNKNLPSAIICDLDGTLALHNNRNPYQYNKCDTDLINKPIKAILDYFGKNCIILFVSGRDDSCKDKTIEWLKMHFGGNLNYDNIYMRKTGDKRKDWIVKQELFDENIRGKYNVEFVLDDRTQVVDMWRALGLTCLQVAEGDF